ncbi:hypothetical protein CSOJ01_00503 [Colletotrichum sojae]|uniref:Uncharacterized protein n=1 Tax=Colletotrichum sojae TaxID=2175907 RepID=A0A8H6JXX7_9PEZI|nr:hypothetical protein CSOJ01_00503 [Colletotrichum sojae]
MWALPRSRATANGRITARSRPPDRRPKSLETTWIMDVPRPGICAFIAVKDAPGSFLSRRAFMSQPHELLITDVELFYLAQPALFSHGDAWTLQLRSSPLDLSTSSSCCMTPFAPFATCTYAKPPLEVRLVLHTLSIAVAAVGSTPQFMLLQPHRAVDGYVLPPSSLAWRDDCIRSSAGRVLPPTVVEDELHDPARHKTGSPPSPLLHCCTAACRFM